MDIINEKCAIKGFFELHRVKDRALHNGRATFIVTASDAGAIGEV
jgi:hypothetical protein